MSSFLIAVPESLVAASADLSSIGSSIRAASVAAAPSTTSVLVAAQDEVSAAVSALFGAHGRQFQSLMGQVNLFHEQFAAAVSKGSGMYVAQEVLSAAATGAGWGGNPVTALVNAAQPFGVFSPVRDLTGRSLFVNGADATTPGGSGGVGG
ncbi:PE family protein, partial [Mycobacterium helveticum]